MYHVRVEDIIVARSDAATAEPLPDGLAKKVYTEPIVIRDDLILVDGLRRLQWHKTQGHEEVPAIRVHDFAEAVDEVAKQYEGRDIAPLRLWNLMSTLHDWRLVWRHNEYTGGWKTLPDGTRVRGERSQMKREETSSRRLYMDKFNLTQHAIQAVVFLYRRADAGDPRAKELAEAVNRGELTPLMAHRIFRRPHNLIGTVTNLAEQRRILERGVAGIQAEVSALRKLGYPLLVSTEELETALAGLFHARSELSTLVTGLRNTLKERNG